MKTQLGGYFVVFIAHLPRRFEFRKLSENLGMKNEETRATKKKVRSERHGDSFCY